MASIDGVTPIGGPSPVTRRPARRGGVRFAALVDKDGEASPPAAAGAVGGLDMLLAVQEQDDDAVADRQARQHGQDMLAALTGMQRALLRPEGVTETELTRLAGLTHDMPFASDSGLRQVAQAIGLRARIELVKRGRAP